MLCQIHLTALLTVVLIYQVQLTFKCSYSFVSLHILFNAVILHGDIVHTLNLPHSAACIKHKSISLGQAELMAWSHICFISFACHFFNFYGFLPTLTRVYTHHLTAFYLSFSHAAHSFDSTIRSEKRISGTGDVMWQVRRSSAWRLGLMSVAIKSFSWGKGLRWRGENTDSVALI